MKSHNNHINHAPYGRRTSLTLGRLCERSSELKINATAAPIKDRAGATVAGIVSWLDITDYKKNQAALVKANEEIVKLRGILPLCSFCKKIRDEKGNWEQIDIYIYKHLESDISHGICPSCMKEHYPKEYESIYSDKKE